MTFIDLLNAYHIMPQFPPAAVKQAEKMPGQVAEEDLNGRLDLTGRQIITIDGDDAKDFDDAVSVEILENKNYMLGVHIADVSHYVRENSAIDKAAFMRGTSVYLIDTVIPMLPFELSNELCSLKPNEIRLTVSVFMEITPRGRIADYKICESYIKSAERMTYNNVTKILDGDKQLREKYLYLIPMLENMKKLAGILKRKRHTRGAVEFVTHESKITLDRDGKPLMVERYPITLSNSIIEEFMLACNETVAKHLNTKGLPCVYRVHEKPDLMRIERLGEILPLLGVDFEYSTDMRPKDFQRVLESAEGMECFDVVNYLVLRTMSKAKYSEKNLGHFGLATGDYCHFTSPIRRYPDLAVHRILKESLKGEISGGRLEQFKEFVVSAAVSSSISEVNAADAELAWKAVKKAEYMSERIGEEYDGSITHVISSGFFAELENTVEGFVAAGTIKDDLYILSDNGLSLVGCNTKKNFTVGSSVRIRVAAADTELNRVDFELVSQNTGKMAAKKAVRKNAKRKISKNDRKILRELKSESREARKQKNESRDKADIEKSIFENALKSVFTEALYSGCSLQKFEKRFISITVGDMAAMLAMPIYKEYLYDSEQFRLKECLISAAHTVRTNLSMFGESFNTEIDDRMMSFAVEYACAALRHFDACLKYDNVNAVKREHEYYAIAKKIRQKRKNDSG